MKYEGKYYEKLVLTFYGGRAFIILIDHSEGKMGLSAPPCWQESSIWYIQVYCQMCGIIPFGINQHSPVSKERI